MRRVSTALPAGQTHPNFRLRLDLTVAFVLSASIVLGSFLAFWSSTAAADAGCANEEIRVEQRSNFLPDCRAYEKVTPADKGNADATSQATFAPQGVAWAALDGERVAYPSAGVFAGARGNGLVNWYMGSRDPLAGWSTAAIDPPINSGSGNQGGGGWEDFGEELELAIGEWSNQEPPHPSVPVSSDKSWYWRSLPLGDFELIVDESSGSFLRPGVFVASADLRKVFLEESGTLYRVDVEGGRIALGSEYKLPEQGSDAASDDGSRVIVQEGGSGGELFLRQVEPLPELIPLTEPAPGAPAEETTKRKDYLGSTGDDGLVFFHSEQRLTAAATGPGSGENGSDLYRYDVANDELLTLTRDSVDPEGSQFQGLTTFSSDGSYVYFVAKGALAAGAVNGQFNLYSWHDDGTRFSMDGQPDGEVHFVTALDPDNFEDRKLWSARSERDNPGIASPGGGLFAFEAETATDGSGYDGNGLNQVYIYDAEANTLRCLTCVSTGGVAESESFLVPKQQLMFEKVVPTPRHHPRNFTQDGSRLFFTSGEPLLPGDVNGTDDVYEYVTGNGQLKLLSTGHDLAPSLFYDTDHTGRDVFFRTRERLVASDTDGLLDLYDARIGGGFPEPAPPPAGCRGETCQGPMAGGAPPPQIGSTTVQVPGRHCKEAGQRATRLRRQAKRLIRMAEHAEGPRDRTLRKQAGRKSKKAKYLAKQARNCRDRINNR